jgi:hypothetical protein
MNFYDSTATGGHRFHGQDLRFEQEAVREAFRGFANMFGVNRPFILSGCEYTVINALNWTCSAGFICLNGEVFAVDQHVFNPMGSIDFDSNGNPLESGPIWRIVATNHPDGVVTLDNGGTAATWRVRKARIERGRVGTGFTAVPRVDLKFRLRELLEL